MPYNEDGQEKGPAEILYGEKTRKEILEKEKRDSLLKKIGDKLTQAQIFYSSNEELEKIANETKNNRFDYEKITNSSLSKEEKLKSIKLKGEINNKQIEKESEKEIAKLIGLGAAEIALTALPSAKGAQIGGKIGQNLLKKHLGRKVSESIGKGAGAGLTAGAADGAIEGIKKNSIPEETIKGAAIGLGTGMFTAGAAAKAEEMIRGHIIKNAPKIDKMTGEQRKSFRKQGQKYYKDYNQDAVVKNKNTGMEINITGKGASESINESLDNIRAFPGLKKDLENAKLIDKPKELYKKRKDDAENFSTLQGENKHLVLKGKNSIRHYLTRKKKW